MRYGYVIRTGGDPEISGAIAEGMLAGRAAQRRPYGEYRAASLGSPV